MTGMQVQSESPVNIKVITLNKQGEDLFTKGDTEGALTAFTKVIDINPNFATAHNNLGVLYLQFGEAQKAVEHFVKAMEIDPNDRATIINCGDVFKSLGQVDSAKNLYSSYLQRNPDDEEMREMLSALEKGQEDKGRMSEVGGQSSEGRSQNTARQKETDTASPEKLYQTAQKLINSGKEKEAIGALGIFLAVYPNYALAHNDLGVLYYNDGNKEEALNHYRQAVRFEPENVTFQKNLADFYFVEAGRVEEALQIYIKLLEVNPTDIETLLILGQICGSLKKVDDAMVFYNKVLEIDPGNAYAIERLREVQKM